MASKSYGRHQGRRMMMIALPAIGDGSGDVLAGARKQPQIGPSSIVRKSWRR